MLNFRLSGLLLCIVALFTADIAQAGPPTSYTSLVIYDNYGRMTSTIAPDPDGSGPRGFPATRTSYDSVGLVLRVESGELATWLDWSTFTVLSTVHHAYDTMNRRVRTWQVGSDGQTTSLTQFNTDRAGRAACTAIRMNPARFANPQLNACVQDTNGSQGPDRISRNIYEPSGQVVQVKKGLGTPLVQNYATYTYTLNGQQEYVTDANGNRARMTYDGHDRKIRWYFPHKTSTGATSTADYEAYTYDNNGNRLTHRKRDGSTLSFQYDALNRATRKTVPSRSGLASTHSRDVFYSYDNRGLQLKARFDSINGEGVTNAYDGFGRMTSSQINMSGLNKTLTYLHDKNGNRTRVTHPDGQQFNYEMDKLDRVTNIKRGTSSLATLSYNNRGLQASLSGGIASSMTYDPSGRLNALTHNLSGSSHDVNYGFGYNTASQIISRSISNDGYVWDGDVNISRNYAVNGLNQYTSTSTGANFQYDANGNLTEDGNTSYIYDIENRLVSASGMKTAGLRYDPLGRLFETSGGSGGTTRFHYDGDELIAEYSGANAMTHRYVHGAGVDDPIIWYDGAGVGSGELRRLRADWQGSIVAVAGNSGNAIQTNAYDDWGIPLDTNLGRFQYTGQIDIPELEMYHYKARIYSPTLGRFLQTDPIGYEDQVNLYAYVGNDPIGMVDPSGTEGVLTVKVLRGSSFDSHAWIEFNKTGGKGPRSYGTFMEDDKGPTGLRTDQEINDRTSYEGYAIKKNRFAFRQWRIDDEQEKKLNSIIADYKNQGTGAWSMLSNCTCFAHEVVDQVTGEDLEPWGIDTPTGLFNSIVKANGNKVGRGVIGGRNPYHGLVEGEIQFFNKAYVNRNWPK